MGNCKNKNCGCQDTMLTSPAPCPTPVGCTTPPVCAEVIDSNCVIYTGDNVSCNNQIVYQENDTQTEINEKIVDYFCNNSISAYQYTEVLLSANDVRSITWNTGFNLLPVLPNGKYYDIDKMAYEFNCDDGNFTCSNPGTYLTAWCGNIVINIVSISLLTSSLDSRYILCPTGPEQISNSDEVPYFASSNNTNSLQLDLYLGINNNSDVITDGANSTLRVKIWYRVRTFGTEL